MERTYRKWTPEEIKKEALKYNTVGDFVKNSSAAYKKARDLGIFDDVTSHMERTNRKWTPEEIKKEALKYNTLGDFAKNSTTAYQRARNLGIYNDVTSHMEKIYRKPINWTPEEIKKEALKYNKLSDFIKNASGVVIKALKLGIYDDVTSRMEKK